MADTLHVKAAATGGGDGSSGSPYTLQEAFDNVAAGDEIIVWADAIYSIATRIDVDVTAGTAGNFIYVRGANSSGTVDGTKPKLQASASITSIVAHSSKGYYVFSDLELDGNNNAAKCVEPTSNSAYNWSWLRCSFHDSKTSELYSFRAAGHVFVKCEFYNGAGGGLKRYTDSSGYDCAAYFCSVHDITGTGIAAGSAGGGTRIVGCSIYKCTGDGINIYSGVSFSGNVVISNNTVFDCDGDGIDYNQNGDVPVIANNSCVSNNGYGYNFNSRAALLHLLTLNNHAYNNSSGATDINGGTLIGDGNQTGAPNFASTTAGSEDFTPGDASALDATGLAAMSNIALPIGAAIAADPAGGGGILRRLARLIGG